MILGYHLVFGAYGFWLPNDPRGSGSWHVWAEHLRQFGPATRLEDRSRSVARKDHDWRMRLAAKGRLKYPAVKFTGVQEGDRRRVQRLRPQGRHTSLGV